MPLKKKIISVLCFQLDVDCDDVDIKLFFQESLLLLSQFFHFSESLLNCLSRYIRGDLVQNAKAKILLRKYEEK